MKLIRNSTIVKFALLVSLPLAVHGQFSFTTNNGTITITGYSGYGPVTIPSTTNGYTVTAIGSAAFTSKAISSVAIPDTVTSIGSSAFYNCGGLTTITLPVGLTNLAYSAFGNCTHLMSVNFPSGLTNIGSSAFSSCSRLTNIALPSGLISIGNTAFGSCTALTNVVFPNGLITIWPSAFQYCSRLANVSIPPNTANIGQSAFANCSTLGEVVVPASVTNCGPEAFASCTSMQNISVDPLNSWYSSVDGVLYDHSQSQLLEYPAGRAGDYAISNGVTVVGYAAFYGCANLTGVVIADSVRKIDWYAFENCGKLARVTIGKGVTNIANYAFTSPNVLTNIAVDPDNAYFSSVSGVLFDKGQRTLVAYPSGITGAYRVPETVTMIGTGAFDGCTNLTAIVIPDNVQVIGDVAFIDCFGLTNVTVGKGVTDIRGSAFNYCTHLTGLYFSGNAPNLGTYVFQNDPATVFYLPGTIGWGATFGGLPTSPWVLGNPLIIGRGPGFGITNNQLGFFVSWATNVPVVVEACTSLSDGLWCPLATNTFSNGSFYFSDPDFTNYPTRFYRIRLP